LKTAVFLLAAVLTNSFGNLLLALAMDRLPAFSATPLPHYLHLLLVDPYLLAGTALSAAYMVAQLSLFSWADLSFVVPVIASSYVVTAFLSEFILGERVQMECWVGVILITVGVALVARTPTATKPSSTSEEEPDQC
jgi:transporter family protein